MIRGRWIQILDQQYLVADFVVDQLALAKTRGQEPCGGVVAEMDGSEGELKEKAQMVQPCLRERLRSE
jgi:hypothetical protein